MNDTIGIDISKETLDTYWLSKRKNKQFTNNKTGLRSLIRWVREAKVSLIVFEATGVYHRLLEIHLAAHDIPFARVNPRQARRFAEGTGTLAKTDRVDAAMLARMGSLPELKADKPKSEMLHNLKGMATARQALIKDRTAARTRLSTATYPLLRQQATLRLRQVERDIAQIDATIETIITADKTLSEKTTILTSIPGIAKITAFAMLIEMPEMGNLSGKQAASLAGLAPISRQSGKWQGKERIQGGRACLRRAIYLPAVVATRFNPDMKTKYHELIAVENARNLRLLRSCASLWSWQTHYCVTVVNGMKIRLDQYGYSVFASKPLPGSGRYQASGVVPGGAAATPIRFGLLPLSAQGECRNDAPVQLYEPDRRGIGMTEAPQILLQHRLKKLRLPTFQGEYAKQAQLCAPFSCGDSEQGFFSNTARNLVGQACISQCRRRPKSRVFLRGKHGRRTGFGTGAAHTWPLVPLRKALGHAAIYPVP